MAARAWIAQDKREDKVISQLLFNGTLPQVVLQFRSHFIKDHWWQVVQQQLHWRGMESAGIENEVFNTM